MGEFENKRVLVTGGSRGIGLGIAKFFAAEGAWVAICGRKEANLQKAKEEAGNLLTFQANLSKAEEAENLFINIRSEFGGLDLLVNNVGMNIFTPSTAEADLGLWEKIIDSNLKAAVMCSKLAVPMMRERGGSMINISTTAAHRAAPGMGIYGIAKAGMEMLTKVLAKDLASYGIRVNAVAPGVVETDFSKPFWGNEAILKEIVKGIPQGRIAKIEDVVQAVDFLASQKSAYLTGEVVSLCGGAEA
jgi:NAD(P)-dependent dehydrogenase (short-subunit alcohol dehydrogenase family)